MTKSTSHAGVVITPAIGKGKERKGKERKGKERKGKERLFSNQYGSLLRRQPRATPIIIMIKQGVGQSGAVRGAKSHRTVSAEIG